MKKTFTLLTITILTIATTTLHAQLNKGSIALGGNLSFYTLKTEDNSSSHNQTSFYVSPSFTSFYNDNHAVGFRLTYSHNQADSASKLNSYGAGVFLRQYKTLGKGFYIFVQEGLNYDYTTGKSSPGFDTKYTMNSASVEVNPGIAYDLNKKIQFEILFLNDLLSASYTSSKNTSSINTVKYSSFDLGANTTITNLTTLNVGAKIFFGR